MTATRSFSSAFIENVAVSAFVIPTETPESDGTLAWNATTLVVVEITAGGETGLGYTYAHRAAAALIVDTLAPLLKGRDALVTRGLWLAMQQACRNLGQRGLVSMAIAACDTALHDLKARLLKVPLVLLLGQIRDHIPVYGSGGFTSYAHQQLATQLGGWAADGFMAVKMKVGRNPEADLDRVRQARAAIGPKVALFVDANGGYSRKQALAFAEAFATENVTWFEEPVSSNDLDGLRLMRDRSPPGMDITAGEYGFDVRYFGLMAPSVDVLQPDATRCAGFTGFMAVDGVAQANELPTSSHCAPALHLHCCCAALQTRHMEWFFDHARIEHMLFDGAPQVHHGVIAPDLSRPGLGLTFKRADAAPYAV
jgi:L-alanine-DL-glutamate epimerase-like enolase superfamily enzyme